VKEAKEVDEVEERKIHPRANAWAKFYPLLPQLPEPLQLPLLPFLYFGAAPAGFRTASPYLFSSSTTQKNSAISQPGSNLKRCGGLTQGLV
jgi:hypothetical protein